jgi:hypothetical protein
VSVSHLEDWAVSQRLGHFDLTKDKLVEVIQASVVAYGGCTDDDPPAARGWDSWRWSVRRLREVLEPERWVKDDTGGLSTVVNHKRRIRIACVRTDDATGIAGERDPQNRSPKGTLNEQATTVNQLSLPGADEWQKPEGQVDEYETWHLCIYIEGDIVRAELSRFDGFKDGYLTDCYERIILLGDGDWGELDLSDGSDLEPDLDINIRRRE